MFSLHESDEKQIGLDEIISQCRCRSPQGNRLKNAKHFFAPAEKSELAEELDAVAAIADLILAKPDEAAEAQRILSQLRELRGTLHGLEQERLLDETEFFELKRAIAIFNRLALHPNLMNAAKVSMCALGDAERLLDPAGSGAQGFYIYSEYSQKLRKLREQKRELEHQISEASNELRLQLLKERNLLGAIEDEEEERVRRELGIQLLHFLPELQANSENCALLDFRIAKAELALKWQACKPSLAEAEEAALIKEAWHPLVQASLKKLGASFSPHSIRLERGATVISGANMGGKSIALQTVFLSLALAQMGYFPPSKELRTPLYAFMTFSAEMAGDYDLGLSSFGKEAVKIREDFRRSKQKRGLIVMDEPCRGTNPSEATAIVQALCNAYAGMSSTLLIASHYKVNPGLGIRFYRIKGIKPENLQLIRADAGTADSHLIKQIQAMMDYHLEEVDGDHPVPSAAIKIAELLGIDPELIAAMKALWQEEKWQK